MLALGRNPDQMAMLRSDRSLMPRAVDEMLRYDGPVHIKGRKEPMKGFTTGHVAKGRARK